MTTIGDAEQYALKEWSEGTAGVDGVDVDAGDGADADCQGDENGWGSAERRV